MRMRSVSVYTRTGTSDSLWDTDSIMASHSRISLTWTSHRVYYLPVKTMHLAVSISRPNLISLGTCFGKFSKTGKFKLQVGSLDYLAQYAKYKVSRPKLLCRSLYNQGYETEPSLQRFDRSGSSPLESSRSCTATML